MVKIQYKFISLSCKDPKVISPWLVEQQCCPQHASPASWPPISKAASSQEWQQKRRTGQEQQIAPSSWPNSHTQLRGILGNVVSSWALICPAKIQKSFIHKREKEKGIPGMTSGQMESVLFCCFSTRERKRECFSKAVEAKARLQGIKSYWVLGNWRLESTDHLFMFNSKLKKRNRVMTRKNYKLEPDFILFFLEKE